MCNIHQTIQVRTDMTGHNKTIVYTNGLKYTGPIFEGNRHGKNGELLLTTNLFKSIRCDWSLNRPILNTMTAVTRNGSIIKNIKFKIENKMIILLLNDNEYVVDLDLSYFVTKLKLSNGLIYSGTIFDGYPHGFGELYIGNDLIYKGDFIDSLYTGNGLLYMKNKVYEGSFLKSCFHGYGCMKFSNPINNIESITGIWLDSKPLAKTRMLIKYSDGKLYEGNINIDTLKKHGMGKLSSENLSIECTWSNDIIDTKVIVKIASGNTYYEGYCVYNKERIEYTGFGKLKTDKFEYEGNFENGEFSGTGKLMIQDEYTSEPVEYTGEFYKNKACKNGILKFTTNLGKEIIDIDLKVYFANDSIYGTIQKTSSDYQIEYNITELLGMKGNMVYIGKNGYRYIGESYKMKKHGYGYLMFTIGNTPISIYSKWINDEQVDDVEFSTKTCKYIGKFDLYNNTFNGKKIKNDKEYYGTYKIDIDFS